MLSSISHLLLHMSAGVVNPADARPAAPNSAARRSSVSTMSLSSSRFGSFRSAYISCKLKHFIRSINFWHSALGSVPQRRASVSLGSGWSGHNSASTLGNHSSMLATDVMTEQHEHSRIEQLEQRMADALQREASLNVYELLASATHRMQH